MKANNSSGNNEQKCDDIDEDESKANDINNSMILKMKEMAEKMSKELQKEQSKNEKVLLLKLHMSDKTYVTVPVHKHTKCSDVINKVIKRKNIDTNATNVKLYHSNRNERRK